jgi:hypothetical protein
VAGRRRSTSPPARITTSSTRLRRQATRRPLVERTIDYLWGLRAVCDDPANLPPGKTFADVDPNMLEVASMRCSAHSGRYALLRGRFEDQLPSCHAVVASLALHHVAEHAEKRELYRTILTALEPAGLVVVADALVHAEGPERRRMFEDLYAHMERNGISAEEADAHLAQWAEEDFYVSLPDELALIADAGFPRPDCFWRDGLIAVYGAFRDGPQGHDRR